ncbi:hypothetical protein vseg_003540 [Gypsophila vaccaria]
MGSQVWFLSMPPADVNFMPSGRSNHSLIIATIGTKKHKNVTKSLKNMNIQQFGSISAKLHQAMQDLHHCQSLIFLDPLNKELHRQEMRYKQLVEKWRQVEYNILR